ncbi:hypothetical protein MRB53_003028 [Persea americana]|uniref:Uncharacterized protein n=1 Tax=Persea americana TaxID=3435 RepID=A0ACC2MWA4_PERAE|nr:hypothetical protein MRB53_003028 [Persea americana]
MLIMAFGFSVLPLTLLVPPCRLFTLFVAKVQKICQAVASLRSGYPTAWARLSGIPSASFRVRPTSYIGNLYQVSYIT